MNEWQNCKLGDVVTFQRGHDLPKDKMIDGNYPVAGSNGIIGFHNRATTKALGVTIGRSGNLGNVFLYKQDFWAHNTTLYVINFKGNDEIFIYYFLKTFDFTQFNVGSAVPTLNRNHIHPIEVKIPPLPEQKAIASVLSSLDDKIDLLHRQNKILEAMAETLFRQWFVEEAEEDWKVVEIGQFVLTNQASITKDYPYDEIEYLDTSSLNEGTIDCTQKLMLNEAPSRAKRLVKHNDILISTVRPDQKHHGIIKNPAMNLVVSTGFCVITCVNIDPHFIYLLLTNDEMTEYLHSIAEGSTSTYPSLKPFDIEKIGFQMPPISKLHKFEVSASVIWEKIDKNQFQIQTLSALRDDLLPKLMSGEVRVKM
ncbi:MAG: restriction endonuclease subunit S [Bacteroidales bacterium]|nr:restriction endonuclease subunit S [Lentimicrobiaceae bacterium]MDD5695241.1 restriction endonuclease subunit S [Bacteroidales bacterium]